MDVAADSNDRGEAGPVQRLRMGAVLLSPFQIFYLLGYLWVRFLALFAGILKF